MLFNNMKIAPINVVQLVLMILVVACPSIGADWPTLAVSMQVATALASASLASVNLYAPSVVPSVIIGAQGIQAIHVVQGMIGTLVTTVAAIGAATPSWGPVVRITSEVGGIAMGILGIFSPKALTGPITMMRMMRMARKIDAASLPAAPASTPPPVTTAVAPGEKHE
jgi:hypothetical protein